MQRSRSAATRASVSGAGRMPSTTDSCCRQRRYTAYASARFPDASRQTIKRRCTSSASGCCSATRSYRRAAASGSPCASQPDAQCQQQAREPRLQRLDGPHRQLAIAEPVGSLRAAARGRRQREQPVAHHLGSALCHESGGVRDQQAPRFTPRSGIDQPGDGGIDLAMRGEEGGGLQAPCLQGISTKGIGRACPQKLAEQGVERGGRRRAFATLGRQQRSVAALGEQAAPRQVGKQFAAAWVTAEGHRHRGAGTGQERDAHQRIGAAASAGPSFSITSPAYKSNSRPRAAPLRRCASCCRARVECVRPAAGSSLRPSHRSARASGPPTSHGREGRRAAACRHR